MRPKVDPLLRFWSKVSFNPNGCWEWKGTRCKGGYGRFRFYGKRRPAHHFLYEYLYGKIPEGLELDHLCKNPSCVNPSHLEAVTHIENINRGLSGKINNANSAKTHCPAGHLYNDENTVYTNEGYRDCGICRKLSKLRYRIKLGMKLKPRNIQYFKQYSEVTVRDILEEAK